MNLEPRHLATVGINICYICCSELTSQCNNRIQCSFSIRIKDEHRSWSCLDGGYRLARFRGASQKHTQDAWTRSDVRGVVRHRILSPSSTYIRINRFPTANLSSTQTPS